jgi:hypothetical protein
MKSFVLQKASLGSRKQCVHLGILAVLGLFLLASVAFALVALDPDPARSARVVLEHRKFPAAALGPVAMPQGAKAGAWNNGSDKVYGLQLNYGTNVSIWELHLPGGR